MKWLPALKQGYLIKRYKRFLADITTKSGEQLTIHCPNTGSMRECLAPGEPIWYSTSNNPKRKYPHTWELATTPAGDLAGINTHNANVLVKEAIVAGLIKPLKKYSEIKAEVKYGDGSRIDFVVTTPKGPWYVEVKNVTLKEGQQGYFPDAVSERGTKHLMELTKLAEQGVNTLLVYCVQHSGIESVAPAQHIDEAYAVEYLKALKSGLKCIALKAQMSADEVKLVEEIPVIKKPRVAMSKAKSKAKPKTKSNAS